ncbi:MAG: SLC13 family permease [Parvibaculales bacterium]
MKAITQNLSANSRLLKILAGPLLALPVVLTDFAGLSVTGERMLAVAVLMAVWWAVEAFPLAVTSLVPLILLPALGIMPMPEVAGSYTHPITFLLFGGFVLAIAIEKCGLHERTAYKFLSLLGVNARYLVGGLMLVAGFTSMWITNTSTTLMLLPVAISMTLMIRENFSHLEAKQLDDFDVAVFLGLAHGATLGGISTVIGTAPNAYAAGFIESSFGVEISFAQWMSFGVPLMLVMLPLTWLVLTRLMHPVDFEITGEMRGLMADKLKALGTFSTAEKRVLAVFAVTVLAWMSRKYVTGSLGLTGITDTTVAIGAVFLLFLIPAGDRPGTLMTWPDMNRLPWGVLLLFGGGFALAAGISGSGLSGWIGSRLAPIGVAPVFVILLCIAAVIIFLTEITSNTATTTTFLPVVAALALEIGQPSLQLVIPAALAASFAFMFPVATPPNAIVFGSGKVKIGHMLRAGLVLNLLSIVVLTLFALYFLPLMLDLG